MEDNFQSSDGHGVLYALVNQGVKEQIVTLPSQGRCVSGYSLYGRCQNGTSLHHQIKPDHSIFLTDGQSWVSNERQAGMAVPWLVEEIGNKKCPLKSI